MKFSVIIPCFNQAHFLCETISSVINQTYSNWEIIIVDDGSTDNTNQIASDWVNKDSRVKLISNLSNKGLANARNLGISHSNGEYISFLDSDDKFSSIHFELFLKEFKRGYDIIFSSYNYFSNDHAVLHTVKLDCKVNFNKILFSNIVPPVAVIYKRSFLNLTGLLDLSLTSTGTEDWDLWIRFYKVGAKLGFVTYPSAYYRISPNSMSRRFITMYEALKIVSLRAYNCDSRISSEYKFIEDDKKYSEESIKRSLMMCLGVAIVQEKFNMAADLLKKETEFFRFIFKESDFRFMCSYLNFRYYISNKDTSWVFSVLYPRFKFFLDEINIDGINKNEALKEIFSIHTKIRNKQKWGFLSPLVNRIS